MIRTRMWYACIYAAGKKKKAKKRAKPAASPRWAQTGPAKSQWKVKGQEPREPFCHSISDSSVRVVRNFRRTRSPLRLIHTTIVPPLFPSSRNPPRPSIFLLLAFVFFCFTNLAPSSSSVAQFSDARRHASRRETAYEKYYTGCWYICATLRPSILEGRIKLINKNRSIFLYISIFLSFVFWSSDLPKRCVMNIN